VPPVVIDNPILNSPFKEPSRYFRFSDEGITDQIADGRRESGYFLPIASPRKKGGQLKSDTEWTEDRFQASPRIPGTPRVSSAERLPRLSPLRDNASRHRT
jgi:hypothetical protein